MHLQENFDEAERLYRRALDMTEKNMGPDHPSYGRKLGNLAILLEKQVREEGSSMIRLGCTRQQQELYERFLAPPPSSPEPCTPFHNLPHPSQGKGVEAESLYHRALAIMEGKFGTDHPEFGRSLNNLASSLKKQVRRRHGCFGVHVVNIGVCYLVDPSLPPRLPGASQGKYKEAEPLYRRALDITEKTLGKKHPDFGQGLNNIANVLKKQVRSSFGVYFRACSFGRRRRQFLT